MPAEHKKAVTPFLLKNKGLFAFSDVDLGKTDLVECDIETDPS